MPIFTQRRLLAMMNDLSGHLNTQQSKQLEKRLSHKKDTKAVLAAEAELAALWSISRVAHMSPEPQLAESSRLPDAYSKDLFLSQPAIIEVRAVSDDSFSGKEAMDRTANIIANFADQLRNSAGKHLYFEFEERSYWSNGFHRERCVDPAFQLTPEIKETLETWLKAPNWPHPSKIRLVSGKTDVTICWREFTHPLFRTHCRMPAVAYDVENNSIYKALKKKSKQMKGASKEDLRCVILFDVGCYLLRQPYQSSTGVEVSRHEIIRHAIKKLSIDVVIVFSPFKEREFIFSPSTQMVWKTHIYDGRETVPENEYKNIDAIKNQLPMPRFEAYQARELHRQGGFLSGNRNDYLCTRLKCYTGGKMTIKISTGLLHEYLAGKINADEFRKEAFRNDDNYFAKELTRGHSIRNIQFEPGGIDEDDDYVVFDLDIDWQKNLRTKSAK